MLLLVLLPSLVSLVVTGFTTFNPIIQKRAQVLYNYLDLGKKYTSTYENAPFWPQTLDECASDASFCVKIALMSDIQRIRVDVRLRLTNSDRSMIEWVILFCKHLLEGDDRAPLYSRLRVFMEDDAQIEAASAILTKMFGNQGSKQKKCVKFNKMSEVDDFSPEDTLFIIVNPNNIVSSNITSTLLEDVQAICFHGALRNIPTIMTNPSLIATAWNDYGPMSPLLLSDFAQAYFICDDFFMMSRRDQFIGLVQRPNTGLDLFMLHGLYQGKHAPETYERIESFPDGMPDNIRSSLAHHLATKDPYFQLHHSINTNKSFRNVRDEYSME